MSAVLSSPGRWLSLTGVLLLILAGLGGPTAAQKPTPGPKADPAKKPVQKPRVEEEEEPGKVKSKMPVRVENTDPARTASPANLPTDLLREASRARHPAVRALYQRLAVPHDELAGGDPIEPIAIYHPTTSFTARRIDAQGRFVKEEKLPKQDVRPYEELAIEQLKVFQDAVVKPGPPLPPREVLQHAERVLTEVVRFHEAARERQQRSGAGWDDLERDLRERLRAVRLDQLDALAKEQKWSAVTDRASQLAATYPRQRAVRARVTQVYAQQADRLLNAGSYKSARQVLDDLERLFPDRRADLKLKDDPLAKVRQQLESKAREVLREVEKLADKNQTAAQQRLLVAESIWPQLPQLPYWRRVLQVDKVLYVGVRHLPTFLSPATAATDAERQAVELLFESLVRSVGDPAAGQGYEMVLAEGSPRLIALGREFHLVHDARWYREGQGKELAIDAPVTAPDVRATWRLFQQEPVRSPEWKELLDRVRVEGDPFRLRLTLQQGYLDPLSLLTFKVLPVTQLKKGLDDPTFARRPIGSGPYQYLGREMDPRTNVEYAVFRANPTYGGRAGKTGQPFIREIRFYSMQGRDARLDFRHDKRDPPYLHVLLDLPTLKIKELTSQQAGLQQVQVYDRLPSRRVWFLAVNHRDPALQRPELRRALALAIDREKILDSFFRDPEQRGTKLHHVLNGPYPAASWACDRGVPGHLFDPARARSMASAANLKGTVLELKVPDDVPEVLDACLMIKAQVLEHTGVVLNVKPCPPAELRQAVERDASYQLAYWSWDHADETYWLWPLFDPNSAGPGGRNLLGLNDAELANLFHKAMQRREFGEVQRMTHMIHRRLYDTMPLIPLWQLDGHLAIHASVQTMPRPERLDPLQVFAHAEAWRLNK